MRIVISSSTDNLFRLCIPGGLWEAGVKSFKTLFYKSTAMRKYTFEELSKLLAKIEACLNSRPLSLLSIVKPEVTGESKYILNRWQPLSSTLISSTSTKSAKFPQKICALATWSSLRTTFCPQMSGESEEQTPFFRKPMAMSA